MEDWIRWEPALTSATPGSAAGGHGKSWPTHRRKNRAFFLFPSFFFKFVTFAKMWFIYFSFFFSCVATPRNSRLGHLLILEFTFGGLASADCMRLFLHFLHAEIRFDNVSRTAQRAMCNQKLGTVDDTCVTSQRERFMSAVKPFVATSILHSCCACDLFFFVLLYRDRGRMLSVLLSLWFSSSFVPLCVQYDHEKTAFHLFLKTAFMYFGLGCFSMRCGRGGGRKRRKKRLLIWRWWCWRVSCAAAERPPGRSTCRPGLN